MKATLRDLRNLKQGATLFGKFYPTGYIVAIVEREDASAVEAELLASGWNDMDVLVADGELIRQHESEIEGERTLLDRFLVLFGEQTERPCLAFSAAPDLKFLLIYAPDDDRASQAVQVLKGRCQVAHRYDKLSFSEVLTSN